MNTIRSRRLPHFQFSTLGGELLQLFDFTFPPRLFGTYPGIGPVPATNAKVHTPAQFVTYTTAGLDEPLTQQYKIHLGIRATELGRDAGKFSSDCTIAEYAGEIWNVQPCPVR